MASTLSSTGMSARDPTVASVKESWNGVALAEAAERDEVISADHLHEEVEVEDSCRNSRLNPDGEKDLDVPRQRDDQLLEELIRLKLTSSATPASLDRVAAVSSPALAPTSRIKLYQPRTKLEQFEDIIMESQSLEVAAAFAEVAGSSDISNGFDFETSDAVFSEDKIEDDTAKDNDTDKAESIDDCCHERLANSESLERLRNSWLGVREDIRRLYNLVLCDAWNDPNRFEERPDLNVLKETLSDLIRTDGHCLFQRLEAIVTEFVLEMKARVLDVLQKSSSQDFLSALLDGYAKLCTAAQCVSPALADLEAEHIKHKFSLTWDVFNKHLYRSIVYTDPLVTKNLSQLRSLCPDNKDSEAEPSDLLVRGYLDLDVEMVNVGAMWENCEPLIEEYNRQRHVLRATQRLVKEAQREKDCRGEPCQCDVCQTHGVSPLDSNLMSAKTNGECRKMSLSSSCPENLSKLYPHLYQTIVQGGSSAEADNEAAELDRALASSLKISDSINAETSSQKVIHQQQTSKKEEPTTSGVKKSHSKVNVLPAQHQHCCSHVKRKLPSVNAVLKGKVPPPAACSASGDGESSSDEDSSCTPSQGHTCCSSPSSMTSSSHHGRHSHGSGGKDCPCGYCEVFGGDQQHQHVAPVSRHYPEMRARLRLLLNKKKKEEVRARQMQQQQQLPSTTSSATSSVSSASIKSTTSSRNSVEKETKSIPAQLKISSTATTTSKTVPKPSNVVSNGGGNSQNSKVPQKVVNTKPAVNEVDSLLEFIEGNGGSANEKKKAKKDRQKQQRLEEIRAKELEERQRREAELAEQKRREEEERRRVEAELQMAKKQKKKAAQRAKKAAAKGMTVEELDIAEGKVKPPEPVIAPEKHHGLEDLRARQMRELRELQEKHQKQFEEEQRKLLETSAAKATSIQTTKKGKKGKAKETTTSTSSNSNNLNTLASAVSKVGPGTQIKITRTANGGVEFTTIPASETATPKKPAASAAVTQPPPAYLQNLMFGGGQKPPLQPYFPPQPSTASESSRPSVPSMSSPSQPMVTIRRIENPSASEPTVTISAEGDNSKKLLYTLVDGKIHRTKDAPVDLIPKAVPLLPTDEPGNPFASKPSSASQRSALPTNADGKLDLSRLHLPPGISISRIQGTVPPERKYFPSKSSDYESATPVSPPNQSPEFDGFPGGIDINNPNVIVVDTLSLGTNDDEAKKKKKKKKKKAAEKEEPTPDPVEQHPYLVPSRSRAADTPNLKSGPQVLIKNVNGNVVITPIPSTMTDSSNDKPSQSTESQGRKKSETKKTKKIGENIEEIDRVFAPKDIDNVEEIDDAEREIEAFKRFCFDSVPLQQKTKVNFDVKNINFNQKKL